MTCTVKVSNPAQGAEAVSLYVHRPLRPLSTQPPSFPPHFTSHTLFTLLYIQILKSHPILSTLPTSPFLAKLVDSTHPRVLHALSLHTRSFLDNKRPPFLCRIAHYGGNPLPPSEPILRQWANSHFAKKSTRGDGHSSHRHLLTASDSTRLDSSAVKSSPIPPFTLAVPHIPKEQAPKAGKSNLVTGPQEARTPTSTALLGGQPSNGDIYQTQR